MRPAPGVDVWLDHGSFGKRTVNDAPGDGPTSRFPSSCSVSARTSFIPSDLDSEALKSNGKPTP